MCLSLFTHLRKRERTSARADVSVCVCAYGGGLITSHIALCANVKASALKPTGMVDCDRETGFR